MRERGHAEACGRQETGEEDTDAQLEDGSNDGTGEPPLGRARRARCQALGRHLSAIFSRRFDAIKEVDPAGPASCLTRHLQGQTSPMTLQSVTGDYKVGIGGDKSRPVAGAAVVWPPVARPTDPTPPKSAGLIGVEEFLHLLARAVRQFHTYPETSPLCAESIAACHQALRVVDQADRMVFRVTPRELIVNETGLGSGTVVEQELVRRLHRAGVASLEIEHGASPRDLARFCADVSGCDERARERRDETTLAEVLVEHGLETIVARMARRPEVLDLGLPPEPLRELVDRDQQRRRSTPATGPVDYLYPPEKGWVRVDPAATLDNVSLVDLAVLVNDPGDMAAMLLRLTDDDPVGAISGDQALEQKFSDVAMLFSALDPHIARVMFGKLARAVLAIDADRRTALLRRTILPGLLDGRADGAVLRDFPDPDLAESLCLLLELETAAPEVVTAALNRLELPADRRQTVASLVDQRLRTGAVPSPSTGNVDQTIDRYARRLVQVDATPGKNFAEFAAFDLSIDNQATETIVHIRETLGGDDTTLAQLDCLRRLVRLEPNRSLVTAFLGRALDLLSELDRDGRWPDLATVATRYRAAVKELKPSRPDVADAIGAALGTFWTERRALALITMHDRDAEGRSTARLIVDAFGPTVVPGLVQLLGDGSFASSSQTLVALMCEYAALLAPGLVPHLERCKPPVACAVVRVLGFAGAGYEVAIAGQLASSDEQVVRASLRALARIGTPRAAALVAAQIQNGGRGARAAEEAIWHFPAAQTALQIRDLLSRRDFVLRHADVVARLIDRLSQTGVCDLGPVLEDLEALWFRVWNPELVRVAFKARGLRTR